MFSFSKYTAPFLSLTKPKIHLAIVDLPDPDSPTIPRTSPLKTLKEILLIILFNPYEKCNSSTLKIGGWPYIFE